MTDRSEPGYTPARNSNEFPDLTVHKRGLPENPESFARELGAGTDKIIILSLLFIPSALETEGFCKSLPYACALFALTDIGRESKDFCGGRN